MGTGPSAGRPAARFGPNHIPKINNNFRARIVVDGVAYAPHRLVSVAEWGVDFYAFSVYK